MKQPAVYIVTNKRNGTLYTGVTSDLPRRFSEHREGLVPGFTIRYGCKLVVWYERYEDIANAILREKQLKAGSRKKKLALIEAENPAWLDLFPAYFDVIARSIATKQSSLRTHWIASLCSQ
jgi:putative endonuclease